jgi:hypothetical protein
MIDPTTIEELFKTPEPTPVTVSEYAREQQAIRDNHQRLRDARLKREVSAPTLSTF